MAATLDKNHLPVTDKSTKGRAMPVFTRKTRLLTYLAFKAATSGDF